MPVAKCINCQQSSTENSTSALHQHPPHPLQAAQAHLSWLDRSSNLKAPASFTCMPGTVTAEMPHHLPAAQHTTASMAAGTCAQHHGGLTVTAAALSPAAHGTVLSSACPHDHTLCSLRHQCCCLLLMPDGQLLPGWSDLRGLHWQGCWSQESIPAAPRTPSCCPPEQLAQHAQPEACRADQQAWQGCTATWAPLQLHLLPLLGTTQQQTSSTVYDGQAGSRCTQQGRFVLPVMAG
jgi:hypothetical protein